MQSTQDKRQGCSWVAPATGHGLLNPIHMVKTNHIFSLESSLKTLKLTQRKWKSVNLQSAWELHWHFNFSSLAPWRSSLDWEALTLGWLWLLAFRATVAASTRSAAAMTTEQGQAYLHGQQMFGAVWGSTTFYMETVKKKTQLGTTALVHVFFYQTGFLGVITPFWPTALSIHKIFGAV